MKITLPDHFPHAWERTPFLLRVFAGKPAWRRAYPRWTIDWESRLEWVWEYAQRRHDREQSDVIG